MGKQIKNNPKSSLFSDFHYSIVDSSVKGYKEVRTTVNYQGKVVSRYIFVKEKAGESNNYYIEQAKARIAREAKNGTLHKEAKNYLKPKKKFRPFKIAIAATSVVALGAAGVLTYKLLEKPVDTFSVLFDTQGGSSIEPQVIQKGKTAEEPENDPTKTGYSFGGWFTDAETTKTFDFDDTPIEKKTVLYAGWKANPYNAKFYPGGASWTDGKQGEERTVQTPYNELPAAPSESVLEYEGHTFSGWLCESTEKVGLIPMTDKGEKYTAQWDLNTYTVSFDLNGGNSTSEDPDKYNPQTVNYGECATDPNEGTTDVPFKEGHTFDHWYDAADEDQATFDFDTEIKSDLVLKAFYTVNKYTITFNTDGGAPAPDPEKYKNIPYGSTITEPDQPKKDNWVFTGWYKKPSSGSEEKQAYDFSRKVDGDFTLTAHYVKETYTVSFDLNGGTGASKDYEPQVVAFEGNATKPINDPTKLGYKFGFWYKSTILDPTPTDKFDFDNTPITGDLILKAYWDDSETKVVVNFYKNDGSGDSTKVNVRDGEYLIPPADPTIDELHTFIGWYTDATDPKTKYNFNTPYKKEGGVTDLYAHWLVDVETYTLTYNYNDVSPVEESTTEERIYEINTAPEEPTWEPVHTGFTFLGWYVSTAADAQAFDFNKAYDADVTAYAHWEALPDTYTITFNYNNGQTTPPTKEEKYAKNTAPGEPIWEPKRDDYTFLGWYVSTATDAEEFDFSVARSESVTIYARWVNSRSIVPFTFFSNDRDNVNQIYIKNGDDDLFTYSGRTHNVTLANDREHYYDVYCDTLGYFPDISCFSVLVNGVAYQGTNDEAQWNEGMFLYTQIDSDRDRIRIEVKYSNQSLVTTDTVMLLYTAPTTAPHLVQFDTNGGTTPEGSSLIPTQLIQDGGTATEPTETLTKGGKNLNCWCYKPEDSEELVEFDFAAQITHDITLIAQYGDPIEETINIEDNMSAPGTFYHQGVEFEDPNLVTIHFWGDTLVLDYTYGAGVTGLTKDNFQIVNASASPEVSMDFNFKANPNNSCTLTIPNMNTTHIKIAIQNA